MTREKGKLTPRSCRFERLAGQDVWLSQICDLRLVAARECIVKPSAISARWTSRKHDLPIKKGSPHHRSAKGGTPNAGQVHTRASSPASEPRKPSQTHVICWIAMPEAIHAVAAYRHATSLGVRVALRRVAKPHAVAAIVRRRDAPAARWRGDASTARWGSAIHPRSEAAGGNCQRQSSAAYDFNQSFQGFLTISSNNYRSRRASRTAQAASFALILTQLAALGEGSTTVCPYRKGTPDRREKYRTPPHSVRHSVPSFLIEFASAVRQAFTFEGQPLYRHQCAMPCMKWPKSCSISCCCCC